MKGSVKNYIESPANRFISSWPLGEIFHPIYDWFTQHGERPIRVVEREKVAFEESFTKRHFDID